MQTRLARPFRSSSLASAVALAAALAFPAALRAQARGASPQSPPSAEAMDAQMTMMAPMMGRMMQTMMEAVLAVAARPETANQMATFTKNYFDALVAKGFTRDEALRIVMAHGFPTMPSMK